MKVLSATLLLLLSFRTRWSHAQQLPTLAPTLFEDLFNDTAANDTSYYAWNDTAWNDTATFAPSVNGTLSPTNATTASPTGAPVVGSTYSPTYVVAVLGQVKLKLMNTPGVLVGDTEVSFLNTVGDFLSFRLSGYQENIEISQIGLMRQYRESRRRLQGRVLQQEEPVDSLLPLYVDLRVVGRLTGKDPADTQDTSFDFNEVLRMLFETFGGEFILAMQEQSDDAFFAGIVGVEAIPLDNAVPTNQPTREPSVFDGYDGQDDQTVDEEPSIWSIGVIVGIAAGGAVILILLLVIVCRLTTSKEAGRTHQALANSKISASTSSGGDGKDGKDGQSNTTNASSNDTPQRMKKWKPQSRSNVKQEEVDEVVHNIPLQEQPSSDVESQGVYSYIKTDSDSVMGGSYFNSNSMINGMDNMSYAYSLEPGIESSVVSGYPGDLAHQGSRGSAVPMEIPAITVVAPQKSKNSRDRKQSAAPSLAPQSDFAVEATLDGIEESEREMQLSPSDLRLTASELAMLPSNLRDSADEQDPPPAQPPTKVIMAPSGKLGIVIDTTVDGPVVHHVNDGSALKGKIFPGDIIVAIDNVDTRAMSASAITGLMIKTANQKRRLTILDKSVGGKKKMSTSGHGKSKKSKGGKR